MNILLTNDDGYKADGINYLKKYFENKGHSVFMVAPDSEKSGLSHSITIRDTIRLMENKDQLWVLRGTPADCVTLAFLGLFNAKIDLVVAGINHGPNIGRDIIYSGTAAAARQGGFMGYTALAMSMNGWKTPFHFEVAGYFLDQYLNNLAKPGDGQYFYNVNFPNVPLDQIKGVKKTIPCTKHYYQDQLIHFDTPIHGRYYWLTGTGHAPYDQLDENSDARAVKENYISVSKVKSFPEGVLTDFEI